MDNKYNINNKEKIMYTIRGWSVCATTTTTTSFFFSRALSDRVVVVEVAIA